MRISENDTFESVILESVKFDSVKVDRHPHRYTFYIPKKIPYI